MEARSYVEMEALMEWRVQVPPVQIDSGPGLGVDVGVILTPPCMFCVENH